MPDANLQTKIKEAIASTDNKHDAQKLLITWAVRDPQLLLTMTKPYLKAIASGLIEFATRAKDSGGDHHAAQQHVRTAIDDIVAAAAGHLPTTDKRKKSNIPPPKSTERQASAMRKLAEAFKKKT